MTEIENVELNSMSGGAKVATDKITEGSSTLDVQVFKLMIGGSSVNGPLASSSNPVPVSVISQAVTKDFLASGNSLYSTEAGELIATPTLASKSVVLSAIDARLATTLNVKTFAFAVVKKISSANIVTDVPVTNIAWNSGTSTVTFADMAVNFASGDVVAMILLGPDKGLWQRIAGENIDDQLLGSTKKSQSSAAYGFDLVRGFTAGSYQLAKTSPGTVDAIVLASYDPTPHYLLLIDRTSAPSGATNVIDSYKIPAGSPEYPTYFPLGNDILSNFAFLNGICLAVSQSDMTYVAASTPANFVLRSFTK